METIKLKQGCIKIGSGATPRGGKQVYVSEGISFIRSQNVYNYEFKKEGLAYISDSHAKGLNNVAVKPNDVLVNITGDSVARICQVPPEILPARVNQHVAIIRTKNNILDSCYLKYVLVSPIFQNILLSLACSGGTRNALTKEMLESLEIPFPPLSEQKAIARILSSLDDKIECNRRMNETLEAMAQAIFTSWFVDFDPVRARAEGRQPEGMDEETAALFPDGFEVVEGREVPKGWHFTKIGDVLELAYGKALKKDLRQVGSIPVYGSNGQVDWHITKLVDGPGIVVGRKGNPGIVVWSHTDFFPIDTTFYVIRRNQAQSLYYLYYELIRQDLLSQSADSAVPGLNRNLAYMNSIIIPSHEVLEKFDELIIPIFNNIHLNNMQSRTLAEIRDTLLPKLISGEIQAPI